MRRWNGRGDDPINYKALWADPQNLAGIPGKLEPTPDAIRSVFKTFDPVGKMNPGKLFSN